MRTCWGRGYATEAARAVLGFGFGRLGLDEIVMKRLGMTRAAADDFDHPNVPEGPFKRYVLYRARRASPRP